MQLQPFLQRLLAVIPHNQDYHSPITGLFIRHADRPFSYTGVMQEPSICLVLQGEREVRLGEQCHRFDNRHFMFCPVNVPMNGRVSPENERQPFVMMSMKIDKTAVNKILLEQTALFAKSSPNPTAFRPWQLDDDLLNAFKRLLLLHENPKHITFLAPLIQQEIYYRLLTGEQGDKLKQMVHIGSHTHKISRATDYIQAHFNQTVNVETLAELCGMSVSGFHSHFKKLTTLSPLQYQKTLRLNTARQLIKQGDTAIARAAFEVGYESPSQFSREYLRQFGRSPSDDAKQENEQPARLNL